MKKLLSNNGATLIEVLIALVIVALFIGPFLSAFVFSGRSTTMAGDVLDLTFVAQRRLEEIQSSNFRDALSNANKGKEEYAGAYVEVNADAYHPSGPLFNVVVIGADLPYLFITTPTRGSMHRIDALLEDTAIGVTLNASSYTISIGNTTVLSGNNIPAGEAVLVFNAAQYQAIHNITLNISLSGRTLRADVYDTVANKDRIIVPALVGTPPLGLTGQRLTGFTNRNFSLLRVRVSVFQQMADLTPSVVMESILQLFN